MQVREKVEKSRITTPAKDFETATKTFKFCSLLAESLAPAEQNDASTSKSGPNMWCF